VVAVCPADSFDVSSRAASIGDSRKVSAGIAVVRASTPARSCCTCRIGSGTSATPRLMVTSMRVFSRPGRPFSAAPGQATWPPLLVADGCGPAALAPSPSPSQKGGLLSCAQSSRNSVQALVSVESRSPTAWTTAAAGWIRTVTTLPPTRAGS